MERIYYSDLSSQLSFRSTNYFTTICGTELDLPHASWLECCYRASNIILVLALLKAFPALLPVSGPQNYCLFALFLRFFLLSLSCTTSTCSPPISWTLRLPITCLTLALRVHQVARHRVGCLGRWLFSPPHTQHNASHRNTPPRRSSILCIFQSDQASKLPGDQDIQEI